MLNILHQHAQKTRSGDMYRHILGLQVQVYEMIIFIIILQKYIIHLYMITFDKVNIKIL